MNDDLKTVLDVPAKDAAKLLLGCLLIREVDGEQLIGKIVETEAYDQNDAASHSFRGLTERTKVMFGPPGFAYVYFTYGMHYCVNVVVEGEGHGAAVLIRALEPIEGIETMMKNRKIKDKTNLTNGPAKLCQALQIDKKFYGHDLSKPPTRLKIEPPIKSGIVTTTRVGISKEADKKLRFYIADNPCISTK